VDFPIVDLRDEDACYATGVEWLHPEGMAGPRCGRNDRMVVHRRGRAPVLDFRCGHCQRVFNAFTGTAWRGAKRRPSELVLIVRGCAQGVPTAQLARELDCDGSEWLNLRHRLQDLAFRNRDRLPLDDQVLEADETFQNAGEKRRAAPRPGRSSASAGEPGTRPRPLGQRPPSGLRSGGPAERSGPPERRRAHQRRDVAGRGASGDVADGHGQHGRRAGVERATGDGPPTSHGLSCGG
jgi:transposase-like protein